MGIGITTNFDVNAPAPADSRVGPYATVAQATGSIALASRYIGQVVIITGSGAPVEYWFNPTTANTDLVVKSGGGTPGGSSTTIQYNNAGVFGGIPELLYKSADKRVDYVSTRNFVSSPVIANAHGIGFVNDSNNSRKSTIQLTQIAYDYEPLLPAEMMCKFEVQSGNTSSLTIGGFKCDYALHYYGSGFQGSRVGTLLGSWDYNQLYAPNLNDSSISGDTTLGELDKVIFSLSWVSATPGEIGLYIDSSTMSSGGGEIIFCGLFTIFTAGT
jgi:hypothetical protein